MALKMGIRLRSANTTGETLNIQEDYHRKARFFASSSEFSATRKIANLGQ